MSYLNNQLTNMLKAALQFPQLGHAISWKSSLDSRVLIELSDEWEYVYEQDSAAIYRDLPHVWLSTMVHEDRHSMMDVLPERYIDPKTISISFYRVATPNAGIRHICEIATTLFDAAGQPDVRTGIALMQREHDWQAHFKQYGRLSFHNLPSTMQTPPRPLEADNRSNSCYVNTAHGPVLLTQRQLDVLRYLYKGYCAKQTASELGISSRTVEMHLRHIKSKIGVNKKHAILSVIRPESLYL